jgi:hypothetical protein
MPTIQSEIVVRVNNKMLFNLTQDYCIRLKWDPFLREARLLGEATEIGIGVRAWCVARIGIGMETEYVFINKPNVVSIKMTSGPNIFKQFAVS